MSTSTPCPWEESPSTRYYFWWYFHTGRTWFFRVAFPVLLALFTWFISKAVTAYSEDRDWQKPFTGATSFIAGAFFLQKYRNEENRIAAESFRDFNKRYDEIESKLKRLSPVADEQEPRDVTISKYFNLCAEEYLQFKQGYIPVAVWESWLGGMRVLMHDRDIRDFWRAKTDRGTYYGLDHVLRLKPTWREPCFEAR